MAETSKIPMTIPVTVELDVSELLSGYTDEGGSWDFDEDGPPSRLQDRIIDLAATRVAESMKSDVREALKEKVSAEVSALVEKALGDPLLRTNEWGEPLVGGKPKTLREMVMDEAKKEITKTSNRGGSYSRDPSVLDRVVKAQVEQVLAKELNEEIAAAKAEVKGAVHGKVTEVIAESIEKFRLGRL